MSYSALCLTYRSRQLKQLRTHRWLLPQDIVRTPEHQRCMICKFLSKARRLRRDNELLVNDNPHQQLRTESSMPGGRGVGGQITSDWTRIQDGRWNNKLPLIGQEFKVADGKQPSDWTIIQDGRWNRTGLNKVKFSDWPKFKFKFSLMQDNSFDEL